MGDNNIFDENGLSKLPLIEDGRSELDKKIAKEYERAMKEYGLDKKKLKNPMKTLARKMRPKHLSFTNQIKEMYRNQTVLKDKK